MAATWAIDITVINAANRIVSVTGTRTDGTAVWSGNIGTYYGAGKTLGTVSSEVSLALKMQYQAAAASANSIASVVALVSSSIVNALNGLEPM